MGKHAVYVCVYTRALEMELGMEHYHYFHVRNRTDCSRIFPGRQCLLGSYISCLPGFRSLGSAIWRTLYSMNVANKQSDRGKIRDRDTAEDRYSEAIKKVL